MKILILLQKKIEYVVKVQQQKNIHQNLWSQKNVHLKWQFTKKRASQIFLDPIQKRALSRSVQLEAVYLEALLYLVTSDSLLVAVTTVLTTNDIKMNE